MNPKAFPEISDDQRQRMLARPSGSVRIVIDTDAKNEIDDQFAITWALLSQDMLKIEGMYAAPFSFGIHRDGLIRAHQIWHAAAKNDDQVPGRLQRYLSWLRGLDDVGLHPRDIPFDDPGVGMERSYEEILRVYEKLGQDSAGLVFRGSDRYLSSVSEPVRSPAAEHLIESALKKDDGPLYVVAIGCITNVVSAMLLAPEIIHNIVVVWTAAYPSGSHRPNYSFNLEQDLLSAQLLFDSGVPLVYLPGFHIGAQLRLSLPEMEKWVRGQGAIGDYLYWLYTNNPIHAQRGITGHFGRTWVIWDLINIAWLLNPAWVPSDLIPAPILHDDHTWQRDVPGRHLMREAYGIDRDAIFRDFFTKLQQLA